MVPLLRWSLALELMGSLHGQTKWEAELAPTVPVYKESCSGKWLDNILVAVPVGKYTVSPSES